MRNDNPLIFSVDYTDLEEAVFMLKNIKHYLYGISIGWEFFISNSWSGVFRLAEFDLPILLNLKLHDEPEIVYRTVEYIESMKIIRFLTIQIIGGIDMLKIIINSRFSKNLILLGIANSYMYNDYKIDNVDNVCSNYSSLIDIFTVGSKLGLQGLICFSKDIRDVRDECGESFLIIVQDFYKNFLDKNHIQYKNWIKEVDYLLIGKEIHDNPEKKLENILNDWHS